jgi:predicted DNA-binding transcriptional regulator YafY
MNRIDRLAAIIIHLQTKKMVVRFDTSTAKLIREQRYYYGFVEEKKRKNGIEMGFMVPEFSYFAKWVLTFLNRASVVSPPELVDMVERFSKQLFDHYCSDERPVRYKLT